MGTTAGATSAEPGARRRKRDDGQHTRHTILLTAARLATERGLQGLSIGDLAEQLGMSKSGLYAHFGSKEELELATIETAAQIFAADVMARTQGITDGLARLRAQTDSFLSHLERQVFPGGCFFAAVAAELDTRPGRARDLIVEMQKEWFGAMVKCIQDAQAQGQVDPKVDAIQVAFEVNAMLVMGNGAWVMMHDPQVLQRARAGIEHVLERAKTYVRPSARLR